RLLLSGILHARFPGQLSRELDNDRQRLFKRVPGRGTRQVRLADATGAPQIEILRRGIKAVTSFIGQSVPGRDLVSLEGELPERLFPAQELNESLAAFAGLLLLRLLLVKSFAAGRTPVIDELAAPNAGSRHWSTVDEDSRDPIPGSGSGAGLAGVNL